MFILYIFQFLLVTATAQKMKFFITGFLRKCDQIRRKRTRSHLLKKYFMENFVFCAVWKTFTRFHQTELDSSNQLVYLFLKYRSSHPEVFSRKRVLNAANLQENTHTEVCFQ